MRVRSMAGRGGWGFWVGWGAAFLGFPIGGLAGLGAAGAVTGIPQALIGGAATGAVIGATQWLVLHRRLAVTPWWIVATAVGMGGGLALGVALLGTDMDGLTLPLRALVTGAGIGIAQFAVLRSITSRAPAWALIVTLGWALGWLITRAAGIDLAPQWSVFGASGAVVFQLLTGLALAWMLQLGTVAASSGPNRQGDL
jgi:hypothetical protein